MLDITPPGLNWKFVPLTTFTRFLEWRLIPNPSYLTHQHGGQAMVPEREGLLLVTEGHVYNSVPQHDPFLGMGGKSNVC